MMDQRLRMHPHPNPPPQAGEGAHRTLVFRVRLAERECSALVSIFSRLQRKVARSPFLLPPPLAGEGWGGGAASPNFEIPDRSAPADGPNDNN
jgi:hypothetical protein